MKKRIYLDNNATTAIDPAVLQVLTDTYQNYPGNPSSVHYFGQEAKNLLTQCRREIASFVGAKPQELLFTSGGTEAANLIMRGIFGPRPSGHLITSNVEHSAVYQTALSLQQQGCDVTFLETGLQGSVTIDSLKQAIRPDTRLIALIGVNNETGVKTAVDEIASFAKQAGVPLFIDGVAWMGKELFQVPLGVSAISFSAHKFHGPKGMGFAVIRQGLKLFPYFTGGGQEDNRRSGTENLPAIVAMTKAIALLKEGLPSFTAQMSQLRDRLEQGLMAKCDVCVNGEGERICNVSNLSFAGKDGESLLMLLDMEGIAVSHGSACSSGALEPSRVLLNMGISRARAGSSLRFSLSRFTTIEEIDRTVEVVTSLVNK